MSKASILNQFDSLPGDATKYSGLIRAAILAGGIMGGEDDPPNDPSPADNPPAGDPPPPDDREKRLAEKEAKLAKMEAAERERKRKADEARRKADEEEAKKRGEHERLLSEKEQKLAEYEERIAAIEAAQTKRIDSMIASLPESVQNEIGVIRGALSLDKLEEFVMLKTKPADGSDKKPDASGNPPPPPNPARRKQGEDRGYKLHEETTLVLDRLYAKPSVFEITAKNMGEARNGAGELDVKFGWRLSDSHESNVRQFIDLLDTIAYNPMRDRAAAQRKRVQEMGL